MFGFYRTAAAVPQIRVADIAFNLGEIKKLVSEAEKKTVSLIVFPELSITGYTCGDLFLQETVLSGVASALLDLAKFAEKKKASIVVGAPLPFRNGLYNCAVVINNGKIKGIVPKSHIPNYREFYEKRWFLPGRDIRNEKMKLGDFNVPFGTKLIFEHNRHFRFAIEICEDLWNVVPPSSYHSAAGALIMANLSASDELVSKSAYRRELVRDQSARCVAGYIYTSSGVWESSTDLVFGGHAMISENGAIISENSRFSRKSDIIFADIDCQKLAALRTAESSFGDCPAPEGYETIRIDTVADLRKISRTADPHPFVPSDPAMRTERCREIFSIQTAGLARRFEKTGATRAVIGISGGLDSTLALLVVNETFKLLERNSSGITAVTMPGFATGSRTFGNAVALAKILKTDLRKIDITEACKLHFKSIGHPGDVHDITYENVQARERTQILMDIANRENGLVIGTGDLSEIALGWSTYNGDHMSMYSVNCGVPKTLIRYIIKWVAENSSPKLGEILEDIIDTPVTPELIPGKNGEGIAQKTEELIGPYELHDFFLYHFVRYGAEPDKILHLAQKAFAGKYQKKEILKWLAVFIRRFFSQQFKRSCIPDGPKVGTICLSPRGDWRMPSDAEANLWLEKLEKEY